MRSVMFLPHILFLALLTLSSCAGPADTQRHYVLPPSAGGRLCVSQCSEARNYCLEDCKLETRTCTNEMQAQAIKDYENYAREQFQTRAPLDLRPRDFERPELCKNPSCLKGCEKSYKSCYENCGGKVETKTSCKFLCF